MNRRAFLFGLVVWFFAAVQCAVGQTGDESVWRLLTRGHGDSIMSHREMFNPALSTNILRLTAVEDWDGTIMTVDVQGLALVSGAEYSVIRLRETPWQKQLDNANMARLRQLFHELTQTSNSVPFLITNLPSKRVGLPTNQVVLVSFLDGTNWVQRQYSDVALPKAIFDCYDVILPTVSGFKLKRSP